jgi:parallel beta-helix repeat protein
MVNPFAATPTPRHSSAMPVGPNEARRVASRLSIASGLSVCALLGVAAAIPAGFVNAATNSGSTTSAKAVIIAADQFSRSVSGGLGTAEKGGSYRLYAGPGKPVSVRGGKVLVSGLAAGGSTLAYLPGATATDVRASITLSLPAGARVPRGLYSSVDLRRQADGSVYRAKVRVEASGAVGLRLARVGPSGDINLASRPLAIKLTPGQSVTLSAEATGSRPVVISARASLNGQPVPAWQIAYKDSSTAAIARKGSVGFWNYLPSGSLPATFAESAFSATSLDSTSAPLPATSTVAPVTPAPTSSASQSPASTTSTAPSSSSTGAPAPAIATASSGGRGAAPVGAAAYAVPSNAIFVSASAGSDSASGTVSSPMKTLGAALSRAASGQTIVLRGGTYHESVQVGTAKSNITIQSYPKEAAWMDGSSGVSGWTQVGSNWVHKGWTKRFDHSASFTTGSAAGGFVSPAYPMAAWPDQVFVNGQQLDQVGSASQVAAGKFAVDYSAQTITVGTNPNGAEVRASDLEQALNVIAPGVTVRGIGVRRYGTPLPLLGTVRLGGGKDTARDLVVSDNATQGLSFRNAGDTADHVTAINNGMTGIHGNYAEDLKVTNSVVNGNNAEHFNESPSSAGIKITRSRRVTITGSQVDNNLSKGIWLDESVVNFTIANNTLSGNLTGIETELSDTGVIANNAVDGGNRGLWIFDTGNLKVFNNYFVNNPIGAIFLNQDQRREANPASAGHDPRQPIPDATCLWLTRNVTIANNMIGKSARASQFQFYALDKSTGISASSMNLTLNGNLFQSKIISGDPVMVGWGGSDNVTVYKYNSPAALVSALGKPWSNQMGVTALVAGSSAVPLPSDIASAVGVASGTKHVGTF